MEENQQFYNPEIPEEISVEQVSENNGKSKKRKGPKALVKYDGLADTYILIVNGYEYIFEKGKVHKVHEDDLQEVLNYHNDNNIIFEQQEEV